MTTASDGVSVIVPTFNEADNIAALVRRLAAALDTIDKPAEIIVVDDQSPDGTADIARNLAPPYPVRVVVRTADHGLAAAVLHGFRIARFDRLVVMDADLQHPPELVPDLAECLQNPDTDFAIGTRYAPGGTIEEAWPWHRRLGSRAATLLARPLAPLSDPMSGFFAVRAETVRNAATIDPIGYKIGLEIYVKGRCRRPAELPIHFGKRHAGDSKLTTRVFLDYLKHLNRLYRFRFPAAWWTTLAAAIAALAWIAWTVVDNPA